MSKRISLEQAVNLVQDGSTVMVGGFLACGSPVELIDGLVEKGVKNLTLICNDTATAATGVGKLVVKKQVKAVYTSHIGTNKESGRQMMAGELEVHLIPQGTLAERIRAGGFGLGGVLTETGVGTEVEKGKQVIEVDGQDYLLEKAMRADIALIYADSADEKGNLVFRGSTRNFNPLMAAAADITIAEIREIVPVGTFDPNHAIVPGIFVKYLILETK